MKVAILVFSPGGHTRMVAEAIKEKMEGRGMRVQVVDVTRCNIYNDSDHIREYLAKSVEQHDVLMIGAPVYAHHFHYNALKLIDALPEPAEGWGRLSIPFVTYGSISSGVSLYEAGQHLKRTGRRNISGLKIESYHVMSRLLSVKVCEGKPGKEIEPLIDVLAENISKIDISKTDELKDISARLNYQKLKGRIKAYTIFREKLFQEKVYPKLLLDREKCIGCGKCTRMCPVQRLSTEDGKVAFRQEGPACIHCGECIAACRLSAISFDADLDKWNNMFAKASAGEGPMPSNENPKSELYS